MSKDSGTQGPAEGPQTNPEVEAMMMRRLSTAALAAVSLVGIAATAAPHAFADGRDFTLYNRSRTTIVRMYVSPVNSDSWGYNQLTQVVVPGDYYTLHFSPGDAGNACVFDVRLDAADGTSTKDWGVDLCSTDSITFR